MSRYRGYTLVEILVVVAIIITLVGILLPVLNGVVKRGYQARCFDSMQKIHQALLAYKQDFGVYPNPEHGSVMEMLSRYGKATFNLTCPADEDPKHDTYSEYYNYWGFGEGKSPVSLAIKEDPRAEAKAVYGAIPECWRTGLGNEDGPGAKFPGLVNAAAGPETIVTVCRWHKTGQYIILRLDGMDDHLVKPTDTQFFQLSKPSP